MHLFSLRKICLLESLECKKGSSEETARVTEPSMGQRHHVLYIILREVILNFINIFEFSII